MFMPGVWILWSKKKFFFVIIFQKENGNTFTLSIIFILKSLQKEQNSTNLLLWPPICWNKSAITPKWFNSLDTNSSAKFSKSFVIWMWVSKFFVWSLPICIQRNSACVKVQPDFWFADFCCTYFSSDISASTYFWLE